MRTFKRIIIASDLLFYFYSAKEKQSLFRSRKLSSPLVLTYGTETKLLLL